MEYYEEKKPYILFFEKKIQNLNEYLLIELICFSLLKKSKKYEYYIILTFHIDKICKARKDKEMKRWKGGGGEWWVMSTKRTESVREEYEEGV